MARPFTLLRGHDVVLCAWCAWTSNPLARQSPHRQALEHCRSEHPDTYRGAA